MAVKVTGVPLGVEGVVGLMLSPTITAVVTDRLAVGEVMPLVVAVTVVLPTATPVATPVALLIVAIFMLPDVQLTWLVMLAVEESEYVPMALKLVASPMETVAAAGEIAILERVAGEGDGTAGVDGVDPPPQPATVSSKAASKEIERAFMSTQPVCQHIC